MVFAMAGHSASDWPTPKIEQRESSPSVAKTEHLRGRQKWCCSNAPSEKKICCLNIKVWKRILLGTWKLIITRPL